MDGIAVEDLSRRFVLEDTSGRLDLSTRAGVRVQDDGRTHDRHSLIAIQIVDVYINNLYR
jgi:hypothetical protein